MTAAGAPGDAAPILMAHSRDGLGGSVITGAELSCAIERRGRETLAVCNSPGAVFDYHQSRELDVVALTQATGLSYSPRADDGNRIRRAIKRLFLIRAAARMIRTVRPAIIHVHDESSALAWGLAARRLGIPMVWHVHQHRPQRWIDGLLLSLSSGVILVAERNRTRFGMMRLPVNMVLYNGVDTDRFSPADRTAGAGAGAGAGGRNGPVVIGFVSNLVPRKRPEWVIHALARLRGEGFDCTAVIAGHDFSGRGVDILTELARDEGVAQQCRILGPTSDVPALLRSIDILALASERGKEGFPRIIVEAMACGLPVVATDVAGVGEAVIGGRTGYLADPDDFDGFVDALRTLVKDGVLRRQLGAAGRDVARATFRIEANVDQLLEFYDRVNWGG